MINKDKNYVKAKIFNRLGASLIDAMSFFLLSLIMVFLVFLPLLRLLPNYQICESRYETTLVDTGFYEIDNGNFQNVVNNFDSQDVKEFDDKIIAFYQKYDDIKAIDDYFIRKDNSGLFDGDTLKTNSSDNDIYTYYSDEIKNVTNYILNHDATFAADYKYINNISQISLYLGVLVGSLVIYLLIPLLLKQGKTLGKKLCNIKIVEQKNILKDASNGQVALRQCLFIVINIFLTLFAYGIPLLINIIYTLCTSCHTSLCDQGARVMCVDEPVLREYSAKMQLNDEK